ncbi:MAG TPA: hypothetical protein VEC06_20345 [Paucimonas sp.]|nr:hypothetical protein [Paucimonas sp.]
MKYFLFFHYGHSLSTFPFSPTGTSPGKSSPIALPAAGDGRIPILVQRRAAASAFARLDATGGMDGTFGETHAYREEIAYFLGKQITATHD